MNNPKYIKGFTLMELIVVIAIIGILSTIVLGSINEARNKGYAKTSYNQMREVAKAASLYNADYGKFPIGSMNSNGISTPGNIDTNFYKYIQSFVPDCLYWNYAIASTTGDKSIYVILRKTPPGGSPITIKAEYCIESSAFCSDVPSFSTYDITTKSSLVCN